MELPAPNPGEFLLYETEDGRTRVECRFAEDTLWLSQAMMAELFQTSPQNITLHLKALYAEGEITSEATCKSYLQVRSEGERQVRRTVKFYNLDAIIAVGYKVNSERAVQFRKWATTVVKEYTVKGFAMDDERLKAGGTVLTKQYFEEQLQRVREIRLSERKFYQKITDIYSTAIDYGPAQDPDDHAGLGSPAEPLHQGHRPGCPAGCRQDHSGNCQGPRRKRVREIPNRARPTVRE